MTKTEIEKIRSETELQITLLVARLNNESKKFYVATVDNVFRSNSFETLVHSWIGGLTKATVHIYTSLNEDYILLARLQRLHRQLLELDVLEQGVNYEQI